MTDLLDVSDEDLACQIEKASRAIRLTITVADLYQANSKTELAQNWLKVWYTAERLAEHALSATCIVRGDELGVGNLVFTITADDPLALAADLIEFAAVYGGDDLEASALIYDEAEDWLKNRRGSQAWFSRLGTELPDDAAQAAEYEATALTAIRRTATRDGYADGKHIYLQSNALGWIAFLRIQGSGHNVRFP